MDNIEQRIFEFLRETVFHFINFHNQYWFVVIALTASVLYLSIFFKNRFFRLLFAVTSLVGICIELALFNEGGRIAAELQIYAPIYPDNYLELSALIFGGSFVGTFFLIRKLSIWISAFFESLSSKSTIERLTNTDIRNIESLLSKRKKAYKPQKYFKKDKIFIGLTEKNKPFYLDCALWLKSHLQITGMTGCGKGIQGTSLSVQAVLNGETVVVFDPKNDEFAPHVLAEQCQSLGKEFIYINLLCDTAQINLFKDKSAEQIEEILEGGFALADTGAEADFYKLADRKASKSFAEFVQDSSSYFSQQVSHFFTEYNELIEDAPKFSDSLVELSSLKVLQAKHGINFKQALERGGVIYVRCTMRNAKVLRLQKMLLLSLMQFCEQRNREEANSVLFFLDEFKYLISRPAMEALGAIRDKRAHVILAHQSLGDLKDCPKDLDPDSVIASVNENCALKFVYKVNDPATAEHFAKMSGTIQIDKETRVLNRNNALAETTDHQRTIRQDERYYIDTNVFQSLPERCGVLFGSGLASLAFTSPIKTTKSDRNTEPTIFEGELTEVSQASVVSIEEELINVDS